MNDWALITGFGAFPGVDINPSETVVSRLAGRRVAEVTLVGHVLDVSFERVGEQLAGALAREKAVRGSDPVFVLHFGVAVGAEVIRVEEQAINTRISSTGDVDGACFEATPIEPCLASGEVRRSSVAASGVLATMVKDLNAHGLPARASTDAGRYVCNHLYFRSLRALEETGVPCLFCHLPEVDEGASPTADGTADGTADWTLDRLVEGAWRVARLMPTPGAG